VFFLIHFFSIQVCYWSFLQSRPKRRRKKAVKKENLVANPPPRERRRKRNNHKDVETVFSQSK